MDRPPYLARKCTFKFAVIKGDFRREVWKHIAFPYGNNSIQNKLSGKKAVCDLEYRQTNFHQ